MRRHVRRWPPLGPVGFTLIELLLAVTLLVLIVLISGYIFDSTMRAVSETQASNEMNISLESFSQLWRGDIRNIEHDGFLVIGGRKQSAFGSLRDRTNSQERSLRNDWAYFYTNSEQYSALDPRAVGQWSRILYGHGRVTDRSDPFYSNLGADWVVLRHQILLLSKLQMSWDAIQVTSRTWDKAGTVEGIETPATGDYIGRWRQYERSIQTHAGREFRFHWYMNYRWSGEVNVQLGDPDGGGYRRAIYEPGYYHKEIFYWGDDAGRRFHALAHCGDFKIQFAMPEDVTSGPGGSTRWRDPPILGERNYIDPNYRSLDPLHRVQTLPPAGDNAGRLTFGPGDLWPALLKLEIHIFDPMDRLEGGKRATLIVSVP